MSVWRNGESHSAKGAPGAIERRALGLLLEGAAINQAQIDLPAYRRFRSAILRDSIHLSEPQEETNLLKNVSSIVSEFESYRTDSETTLEGRQKEWRQTISQLVGMLAAQLQIDPKSHDLTSISVELNAAVTSEEIEQLRISLHHLFHRSSEQIAAVQAELADEQDRSTANDNAAGLRGGGAAIEQVRSMIAQAKPGYIALFRLSCLDVVGERFGAEGIQDCLMAVSAFLIETMRSEDTVYHWSESSLLAVCDRKVREDIITAELNRVLAHNRDFTIKIGDRTIMLRIPIDMQLFPITYFNSAEDLQHLPSERSRCDRSLADRVVSDRGMSQRSQTW